MALKAKKNVGVGKVNGLIQKWALLFLSSPAILTPKKKGDTNWYPACATVRFLKWYVKMKRV